MPNIDPITGRVIPDPFNDPSNTVPIPLPQLGGAAPASAASSPALPDQFQVSPPTPAQQAYSDWANSMPKRPRASLLGSVLAGLAGGAAGFANVKAGYPGGPKAPFNAQPAIDALSGKTGYAQSLQDWSNKGAGLKEAANEEQQRVKDQLGLDEARARIEASKSSRSYADALKAETLEERKAKDDAIAHEKHLEEQQKFTNGGGVALPNVPGVTLGGNALPPPAEGLPAPSMQTPEVNAPLPEGARPAVVDPSLFGPHVTVGQFDKDIHKGMAQVTPEMAKAGLGLREGEWVPVATANKAGDLIKQAQKPASTATTAAAKKAEASGVTEKLVLAGLMQPPDANDFGRLGRALDAGVKTGAITPQERAKVISYEAFNNTPGAQNAAGQARAGAYASARSQYTPLNMFDKMTGEIAAVPESTIIANPGRFTSAAGIDKWVNRDTMIKTMKGNIANVRGSLQAMPDDLDNTTRALLATAINGAANAGAGETGAVSSAFHAVAQAAALNNLSPEAQNYLANVQTLAEDAMGLRQILGTGQGAQDVRKALLATVPGAGTTKEFGAKQLDNLNNLIDSLGAPAARALRTGGIPGQPPGALPPGAAQKTYTQADLDRAIASHPNVPAAQIKQSFIDKGWKLVK